MNNHKTWKTGYVSDADKFLESLEKIEGASTPAKQAEEEKYRDIMGKRDTIDAKTTNGKLWKGF